ncbi:MAG: hypothetical protein L6R39_000549 [Caloplaca ligustica]|nr:MAG: hypothetical protein L6R39_000549 [Caloplaca ligustica]
MPVMTRGQKAKGAPPPPQAGENDNSVQALHPNPPKARPPPSKEVADEPSPEEEVTYQQPSPKKEAQAITKRILSLVHDRARLLGLPKPSKETKDGIVAALDDIDSLNARLAKKMSAEIVCTRKKILKVIADHPAPAPAVVEQPQSQPWVWPLPPQILARLPQIPPLPPQVLRILNPPHLSPKEELASRVLLCLLLLYSAFMLLSHFWPYGKKGMSDATTSAAQGEILGSAEYFRASYDEQLALERSKMLWAYWLGRTCQ